MNKDLKLIADQVPYVMMSATFITIILGIVFSISGYYTFKRWSCLQLEEPGKTECLAPSYAKLNACREALHYCRNPSSD